MPLTAIAGVVGDGCGIDLRSLCHEALAGLGLFGSDPRIERLSSAAFGALAPAHSSGAADSSLWKERRLVAIDGSLSNEADIRRELSLERSTTAGVIAAAWNKWGDQCLERFVGEFAIAMFDPVDRRLWLARDPSGYRSLFYAKIPGGFAFASMPSGLLSIAGSRTDLARLGGYAEGALFESGWTFWTGLHQVPSGCLVELPAQTRRPLLTAPIESKATKDWNALVIEMRARLDSAVTRSLAGAGPLLGGQLSSGLDSSAVVATAARSLGPGQSMVALTAAPAEAARLLVPRGRCADEARLAARTAGLCGLEHVVIREREKLIPAIRGSARYFQQPAPAQFSFPWWRAMNHWLSERGGRVMLTAGMGNGGLSYGASARFPATCERGTSAAGCAKWLQRAHGERREFAGWPTIPSSRGSH